MEIYVQVLLKRIHYIILTVVVSGAAAFGITSLIPEYYRSTTTLLVQPFGLGSVNIATYNYSQQLATTFSSIIGSEPVYLEVAQQLGIDPDEEDLPTYSAGLIPDSELFQIAVTDPDPLLAQEVADILAAVLIERITQQYSVNLENIELDLRDRITEMELEISTLVQERAVLVDEVPRNNVRIAEIDQLLLTQESVYRTLQNSLNDMIGNQSAQSNLISIFEPATLPDEPAGPSMILNLLAGITTGIVGGVAIAFLLEALQPKLYSEEQVESIMDAQILSNIPKMDKRDLNNVMDFGSNRVLVEYFRRLRNTVESVMEDKCDRKSLSFLTFVDMKQNEEIGVLLIYFANMLARSSKRTLIVDVNSYQPVIHKKLGLESNQGITDVLDGKAKLKDVIQQSSIDNLDFMSVGTQTDFAVELYASEDMTDLIAELEQEYDFVLFNSPPILTVTDGVVVARRLCTNVIVMKPDAYKTIAARASEELQKLHIDVLGVILYGTVPNENEKQTRKYVKSKA